MLSHKQGHNIESSKGGKNGWKRSEIVSLWDDIIIEMFDCAAFEKNDDVYSGHYSMIVHSAYDTYNSTSDRVTAIK